jgi:cellulose synthase/poly-beta-1,6-N-acetylglucosamine synthase-like glycosyltransferase
MISVIIPAYNAASTIRDTIEALLNQNYPKNKYEIIVVDDGSKDDTIKIVKSYKKVRLIQQKHKGPAAARNLGAKKARGSILLFTDSDCIPSKNWIRDMIEPLKNSEIVGVSGTYKTLNKESIVARFVGYEIERNHEMMKKQKYIDFIGSYSAAYRKEIFLKFGGFDESFPIASGEDPELSFRISKAGYKMVFQPKAYVYHRHPDTLKKFLRQQFWRGYWRVLLYKKHTDKMFRHSYTPLRLYFEIALLGLSSLLLMLGFFGIVPIIYGLFGLFLTFLLTLPFSLQIFKKDKKVGLAAPFIILLRNFFVGLGILFGLKILFQNLKK